MTLPEVWVASVSERHWRLIRAYTYEGKTESWTVPKDFRTDFASVPRVAMWLFPPTGRWTVAAIVHDYLCDVVHPAGGISGRDVDGVFRRILRETGVPAVARRLLWVGVRWGALGRRRDGWLKDLPLVALWSLLAAPVVLPAALCALVGLALYSAAEWVVQMVARVL